MNDGFGKHLEYRDAGVEWLGEIPAHWEVRRLKSLCSSYAQYGANMPASRYCTSGVRFVRTTDIGNYGELIGTGVFLPEDSVRSYILADGDLLISRSGTIGRSFLYERRTHGCCAYAGYLVRFVPNPILLSKYAFYYTKSRPFVDFLGIVAISSTIDNVNGEKYAHCPLPLPPAVEQAEIVRFLDRETAKIDHLVAKQRELMDRLQEKRTALISRAVIKGLDLGVPLKDSHVEWLGEIPEHWVVAALRYRYEQTLGKMLDTKQITGNFLVPYLRNIDVQWDHINIVDLPSMDIGPHEIERFTVRSGDLLVCEGGEAGRCAIWRGGLDPCGYQKALHRLRPIDRRGDRPRFLYYTLAAAVESEAFADGQGSTIPHLTGDMLRAHRFPFPPASEQQAIADHLDHETAKIDALTAKITESIDLLDEYRAALISAAVTGKIDVRDHPAATPTPPPSTQKIP